MSPSLEERLCDIRLPTLTSSLIRRLEGGLRIRTVRDLLWHIPARYEERGNLLPIGSLRPDASGSLIGTVERIRIGRTLRRKMAFASAVVGDPTGTIQVVWFNQPWMADRLRVGDRVLLTGKVSASNGRRYLPNPAYEILERLGAGKNSGKIRKETLLVEESPSALIPVYPETEGVTSRWLNYLVREAFARTPVLPDPLPDTLRNREGLSPLYETLKQIHLPKNLRDAEGARNDLLFRELFVLQCAVLLSRAQREAHRALSTPLKAEGIRSFTQALPFRLTESQRVAAYEILRDMERPRSMHRLLVGDVGSGKTVVAAIAVLNTVQSTKSGRAPSTGSGQAALMAPTEILAKQHFETLAKVLTPFGVRIALLTGSYHLVTPKRIASERTLSISKPKLFKELAEGGINVLVGTHALITRPNPSARLKASRLKPQGPLRFKKLLLAVIDEQHRFGVTQRRRMTDAEHAFTGHGLEPHLLTLTATPIPRTLALTIFGDLDVSQLRDLPSGRQPITTHVLTQAREGLAFAAVRAEIQQGRQAFIICPLVSPSEKIEARAALAEFERLKSSVFPDLALGLLHGQMKSDEKTKAMRDFARGKIAVLVATPVVEVGIDIPNATVMVVLGAERFGLAQLYQLRGRVGRGSNASSCYFITGPRAGAATKARLQSVARAKSGSEVAEADLKLRGPGELLGAQQSGVPDAVMQALTHPDIIRRARESARTFLTEVSLRTEPLFAQELGRVRAQLHLS